MDLSMDLTNFLLYLYIITYTNHTLRINLKNHGILASMLYSFSFYTEVTRLRNCISKFFLTLYLLLFSLRYNLLPFYVKIPNVC